MKCRRVSESLPSSGEPDPDSYGCGPWLGGRVDEEGAEGVVPRRESDSSRRMSRGHRLECEDLGRGGTDFSDSGE